MTSGGPWAAQPWSRVDPSSLARIHEARIHHGNVSYAGFWARGGGLFVDGLVIGFAQALATLPLVVVGWILDRDAVECRVDALFESGRGDCESASGLVVALAVAAQIVNLFVWWRFVPLKLAERGSTVGMKTVGLRLVTAEGFGSVSRGQACVRALFAILFPVLALVPWIVVAAFEGWIDDPPTPGEQGSGALWVWVTAMGLSAVALFLTYLWNVVDRRYQTLHDKLAGTVVIRA